MRQEDGQAQEAPLFLDSGNLPLRPNELFHPIGGIWNPAGVPDAFPHKFRHTSTITSLRSKGEVFTFHHILGHSSLDIARNIARIDQSDLADAYRKASPVANWRLLALIKP